MSQTSPDPVVALLSSEHELMRASLVKLDGALRALVTVDEPEERAVLAAVFDELLGLFNSELGGHMGFEEEHLFPAMERYISRESGPLAVMLYEHQIVRRNLARFGEAFAAWKGAWPAGDDEAERRRERALARILAQAAEEFAGALSAHALKEDNLVFPMALRYLSSEELKALAGVRRRDRRGPGGPGRLRRTWSRSSPGA